jgi:hypothetical protein
MSEVAQTTHVPIIGISKFDAFKRVLPSVRAPLRVVRACQVYRLRSVILVTPSQQSGDGAFVNVVTSRT